jgi:hypothetical protein
MCRYRLGGGDRVVKGFSNAVQWCDASLRACVGIGGEDGSCPEPQAWYRREAVVVKVERDRPCRGRRGLTIVWLTHSLRPASACSQAEQLLSRIRAAGAASDSGCGERVSFLGYTTRCVQENASRWGRPICCVGGGAEGLAGVREGGRGKLLRAVVRTEYDAKRRGMLVRVMVKE